MTGLPLTRTEYWNLSFPGTVRSGSTAHSESLIDIEDYLMPLGLSVVSSLHTPGVADGLTISATPQQPGVTVSPGVALDVNGHVIVLALDGFAVVDRSADPSQLVNVPTVQVSAAGAMVDSAGLTGQLILTMTYAEVAGQGQLSGAPVLIHAPWLRLLAPTLVTPEQVILAGVTLDAAGNVTSLSAASRVPVGLPASRLQILRPRAAAGPPLSVDQFEAAELASGDDGGLTLDLTPAGGTLRVLAVDGAATTLSLLPGGGTVGIGTAASLQSASAGGFELGVTVSGASVQVLAVDDAATTLSLLPGGGTVGIGLGSGPARRVLHVEGTEIHSGGPAGGFSFANRQTGGFVESPAAGERWVWYAAGGQARLWSGADRLSVDLTAEGGGLDVPRRMRVRQGGDASAGIWFFQSQPQADRAFVGMADDTHVGFWGNNGVGWGLRMDTTNGNLAVAGDVALPASGTITSPGPMHISGSDRLYLLNTSGVIVSRAWGGNGELTIEGRIGVNGMAPSTGLPTGWGGGVHTWDVFAEGSVGCGPAGVSGSAVPAGMDSSGVVWGRSKHFVIDHPLDPEHRQLLHACIEGPETGVYYRGEGQLVDGKSRVALPDYFEPLARTEGRTVLLTAICEADEPISVIAASPVLDGGFDVRAADDRNPSQRFCWEVKAIRTDVPALEVERAKAVIQDEVPAGV